ncbi:MAG: SUMF1/EgtB/PvdO family nonheme iron enzyme [Deltaproteobacteria bacterium]|nr:SUMF1/EgtB/PvdO family nonheme iron enzyme [Deltaproteobacteria bacterium]
MHRGVNVYIKTLFFAVLLLNLLAVVPVFAAAVTNAPPNDEDGEDVKPDKPQRRLSKKDQALMDIEKNRVKNKSELPLFKMVLIKGGCFEMGDFAGEGDEDERPVHEVCVSSFLMSETEVTQELFEKVMGFSVSSVKAPTLPVTQFRPKDVVAFLKRLNELTKGGYRLPSEAEWEYAARDGGKKMRWAGTDNEDALGDYAWFDFNSEASYHLVKQKKPNAFGLYDMSGNVAELCEDYLDFEYYKRSPKRDPLNERPSPWRVVRGGSLEYDSNRVRTTFRYAYDPKLRFATIGLRLAQ